MCRGHYNVFVVTKETTVYSVNFGFVDNSKAAQVVEKTKLKKKNFSNYHCLCLHFERCVDVVDTDPINFQHNETYKQYNNN